MIMNGFIKRNWKTILGGLIAGIVLALLSQCSMVMASAATPNASITKHSSARCNTGIPHVKLKLSEASSVEVGLSQSEFESPVVYDAGTSIIPLSAVGYGKKVSLIFRVTGINSGFVTTKKLNFSRPKRTSCVTSSITFGKIKPKCEDRKATVGFTVTPVKKTRLEQKSVFVVTLTHKVDGKTVETTQNLKKLLTDEVDSTRVFSLEVEAGYSIKSASVAYYRLKGKAPTQSSYYMCAGE
jgi:hypothetical protein